METIEAILTRRSIRKFKKEVISQGDITELLKAAMSAPSAWNEQPWHFIVIDDRTLLNQIPTFSPYAKMCDEAPLAILVCGDLSLDKHKGYWIQGCAAATENLLLAAHDRGFGAVWTGVFPNEDRQTGFRKLFSLPQVITPFSLVVLGHPMEHPPSIDRFQPSRIHKNGW